MNGTAVNAVILIITTLFAKVLGFGRELSLAYVYGATGISDAYIVAYSIPTIIFSGLGTAILTSYIPIYTELAHGNDSQKLKKFHNSVISIVILLSIIIIGVFLIFARQIVRLFAVGFSGETFELSVTLSCIMILSVLFISVYFILEGYLEINGRFLAVGLVSVPLNLAVIATILFTRDMDHRMLAWGVVIGYAASFLMLYICSKRIGFSYSPSLDLRSPHIRKLAIMVVPVFLGKTINQINILIDRTIASTLSEGSISAISYANRIIGFVTSVFVISVATAIYPKLSTLSAENDKATIKKTFGSSISIISYIVLPLSAGLIILAKPVVSLMFERGAFTSFDVERTAEVIVFYAMGLLFFSIKEIAINVFYAIQDMKTPMINSAIAIVLNFGLNLILIQTMQHKGLALATTISGAVTLVLMLIVMRRKLGPMGFSDIFTNLLKMLIASAVMSCVVYPLYNVLSGIFSSVIVTFGISVLCGMAVYFIMSVVLRIKEFRIIMTAIIERLGRRTKKESL